MKGVWKFVGIALASATLSARADYLFTWHYIYPQLQTFHGTFEVTDAEMQPGSAFNSGLFYQSILLTGSTGAIYHGDPAWTDATGSGSGPPINIDLILHDDSHTMTLTVATLQSNAGGLVQGRIYEFFPADNYHEPVIEDGYWTFAQIPEPCAMSLITAGGILWSAKHRKRLA